jgi:PQQ-like domain
MAVFLVALLVFVLSVWRTSEIRNVHSHPTAKAGKDLASGTLPSSLHSGWHTTDRMALGQPVYLDVVATYSAHTVVGRDAVTGVVRWSYSRADRSICSVVGDGGVVMAIYRHDGNCDELSALAADTGKRAWTRTQFDNGTPTVQPISQSVLEVTPDALDLLQPAGGATYWYYPQVNNCKTISGVLGTAGVLWGTRCSSKSTLTLRAGSGDKSKNNSWSVSLDGRTPLAADSQILALTADGRAIQVLSAKDGTVSSTIPLASAVSAPSVPFATPSMSGSVELITVAGQILAVAANGATSVLWARATNGRAADTSAGLLFPSAGLVSIVDSRTGATVRTIAVPGLAADSSVAVRGLGLVSSNSAGTTAWD